MATEQWLWINVNLATIENISRWLERIKFIIIIIFIFWVHVILPYGRLFLVSKSVETVVVVDDGRVLPTDLLFL